MPLTLQFLFSVMAPFGGGGRGGFSRGGGGGFGRGRGGGRGQLKLMLPLIKYYTFCVKIFMFLVLLTFQLCMMPCCRNVNGLIILCLMEIPLLYFNMSKNSSFLFNMNAFFYA